MPVYEGSRYEDVPVSYVDNVPTLYPDLSEIPNVDVFFYTIVFGDRLDLLAEKYLGDVEKWVEIAQVNPDVCFYPHDLPVGKSLRIPLR